MVIGTTDLSSFNEDAQRIEIETITVYESYNPNNASRIHDIALLLVYTELLAYEKKNFLVYFFFVSLCI